MRAPLSPHHAPRLLLGAALGLALAACSASGAANGFSAGGSSSTTGDGSGGDIGLGGGPAATSTGTGGQATVCKPGGPGDDVDGDGFTPSQGDCDDCDDCDPFSNPNAVEVIADDGSPPKDESCDGTIDEAPQAPCDQDIGLADLDPMQVPRAVELCTLSTGPKDWGVVSSTWVLADGTPPTELHLPNFHLGHGSLSGFGANVTVRAGKRMLGLSSGTARAPTDPDYHDVSGFGCPNMGLGPGSAGGGMVFDCAFGDADLLGTGFGFDTGTADFNDDHGSTGWLQTRAPAEPGPEISLRWAVYNSRDGILDTTTLIDNWKWLATPGITVITSAIPK